jgi:hypothetical protein
VVFDNGQSFLSRIDIATGAIVTRTAWPGLPFWSGHLLAEPARNAVLIALRESGLTPQCPVTRVDAFTFSALPTPTVVPCSLLAGGLTVSPAGDWMASWRGNLIVRTDLATGVEIDSARGPASGQVTVAIGWPPLPPRLAPAAVANGAVSMMWTLPDASPQVTGYRLEAGYAPGTTAVSLDLGPSSGTSIPGVPAGRYYARIRAVNANGVSAPSNEIVIDVP